MNSILRGLLVSSLSCNREYKNSCILTRSISHSTILLLEGDLFNPTVGWSRARNSSPCIIQGQFLTSKEPSFNITSAVLSIKKKKRMFPWGKSWKIVDFESTSEWVWF